jgi:hypothetical protein
MFIPLRFKPEISALNFTRENCEYMKDLQGEKLAVPTN